AKQRKDIAINKMATVSARSFTVEETERYAGSLGDPSRMVSNYAGVAMTNDSRNDIIIRGNSPSGLLWRLDGIEIPNPNHFGAFGTTGGPVSMLNNNLLTNSDFFTSAFPAEYGNAMSGVFDLRMRAGNNEKPEYVGQIGFNGFELGAEGPFKKGGKSSYLVNYRYSTLGVFNALGIDMGTGLAIPQYQDLTFKLNFPGTKYGRFSLVGMGGLSYIELHDSKVATSNNQDDSNYNYGGIDLDYGSDLGVIGLSHLYFFNEKTRIQSYISVLATRTSTYIDSLKFDDAGSIIQNTNYKFYESTGTEVKYSASTHLKSKFNSRNNASVGVYYDIYQVNYLDSVRVNEINGFANNLDSKGNISLLRAYGQWQHRFNDKLTLNAGVYSHYVDLNKETTFEPRLGLKYNLTNTQSLSLGYGLHSQMQPRLYYFQQSLVDSINMVYSTPNKEMKMSKSHQFVLGYDRLFSENLRFKTELYYQSLYNIPVSETNPDFSLMNGGDSFGGQMEDSLVNNGTGTNYGVEFTLERFFNKGYYLLTTLSLFESKYEGHNGTERNTAFNGNYVVNILGGYEFAIREHNALSVSLRTVYAGGKRFIPIDIDESIETNTTAYNWNNAYEDRFDDYFRTDLRISFKMNGKRI
ncbi:MAG: TonB-dependent receptor, partial [Bacteroidota bacterium]|nr:TonB-dependent receptor [Bacteroidota bacterium]